MYKKSLRRKSFRRKNSKRKISYRSRSKLNRSKRKSNKVKKNKSSRRKTIRQKSFQSIRYISGSGTGCSLKSYQSCISSRPLNKGGDNCVFDLKKQICQTV